jgi:hypothetical protein
VPLADGSARGKESRRRRSLAGRSLLGGCCSLGEQYSPRSR